MRLLRYVVAQRDELQASRAAEAEAAAAAERGRLAREMHDVLAHSLSALALQLEATRLLARDRGVDEEVTREIDRAHTSPSAAWMKRAARSPPSAGTSCPGLSGSARSPTRSRSRAVCRSRSRSAASRAS